MGEKITISGGRGGTVRIDGGDRNAVIRVNGGAGPPGYGGPYEFTPTEETQTARIAGMAAAQDIIINPIPSNYGRVSYNGRIITIT